MKWKDLYLSSNGIYLNDIIITGDTLNGGIKIINISNQLQQLSVNNIKLQSSISSNFVIIKLDNNGLLTFQNSNGANSLGISYNNISYRPFNYISSDTLYSSNNFIFSGSLISSNTILYGNIGINTNNPRTNLDVNGSIYANTIQSSFIGDGTYLSNINASNIIGILSVSQGGTGCNSLPLGQLIIGNNNNPIITSPNLLFNNNTLQVNGNIITNTIQGSFIGDGTCLSNINASNIIGVIDIKNGGTGCNLIPLGQIMVGNNNNSIITSPNFIWNNSTNTLSITGTINTNTLNCSNIISTQNYLIGDGSKLTNIVSSNIIGVINVNQGGTGCNILPSGQLLIGNNNSIITTPNLLWNNITNELKVLGKILTSNIQGAFIGDGSYLSNINASNIIGIISVSQGGTGCNLIPQGQIIVGNNTNPIITTPNLIWDNINNKLSITGTLYSDNIQGSFIGNGINLSNINPLNLTNVVSVIHGGTGCNILPYGEILVGNSQNPIISTPNFKWINSNNNLIVTGSIYANTVQGKLLGNGYNISNINATNIVNILQINQGGTGCNVIPYGQVIIGNLTKPFITTPNFTWSNITNKLLINGSIYTNTIQGSFIGNGSLLSNIDATNIIGTLSVINGGTGCNTIPNSQILIGNDNNSIITTPKLKWDNVANQLLVNGKIITSQINATNIYSSNIQGNFIGDGKYLSNIDINNINSILNVIQGGTGCNLIPSGELIIGNNQNSIITTPKLKWNNITNELNVKGNIYSGTIQGLFIGDGTLVSNINASNIIGTLSVSQGGTGCNILPSGQLIIGNNQNAIITTPNLKWDNSLNQFTINGKINSYNIQGSFIGDGSFISNINASNIIGILPIENGGTGCNILPYGQILIGNYSNAVITSSKLVWSNVDNKLIVNGSIYANTIQGNFIGDGKNLSNINASNIIGIISLENGGTGCNTIPLGELLIGNYSNSIITTPKLKWDSINNKLNINGDLYANNIQGSFYGDGLNISNIVASNIIGIIDVLHGGTGCNLIPTNELIIGNNNSPIITTPNLTWNNTSKQLNIKGTTIANIIQGQLIGSGTNLSNINANNINGVISIEHGGTGCNIIPYGQIAIGNNLSAIITTPNFVWSNIENKLIVKGNIYTNDIQANFIGDGLNISNIVASNIIGILDILHGGTGCNLLPLGQLIIGNNNNPIITTPNLKWDSVNNKLNINGNIYANNIQGSLNGNGLNISNIVASNIIGTIGVINGGTGCNILPLGELMIGNNNSIFTTPKLKLSNDTLNIIGKVLANQIQGNFIGDGTNLSNIVASNIIGIIDVIHGGTGCNILPYGQLLIGNNSNSIITTPNLIWSNIENKLIVNGSIITSNIQANYIETNYIYTNSIQGSFIGDGNNISNINPNNISGIVSVIHGGTGCNILPFGQLVIGNDDKTIITTPNLVWSNNESKLIVKGLIYSDNIQGKLIGDGSYLSNINLDNTIGIVTVNRGGTGCNILPYGQLLIGNYSNSIITTSNLIWSNIDNRLIVNGSVNANNLYGNFHGNFYGVSVTNYYASNVKGIISLENGGTGCNIIPVNQILIGNYSNAIITSSNFTWNDSTRILNIIGDINASTFYGNVLASNILGTVSVINGGTGCNLLPFGQLLIGNNSNAIITTPNLIWNNITNTLNINGKITANNIQGNLYGDGTNLSNVNINNITGIISVINGGTGRTSFTVGNLLLGNGVGNITDTANLYWNQTNSSFTINGKLVTNKIQGSFIGDGYGISNIVTSNLIGILPVSKGGIGTTTFNIGEVLYGNGTNKILSSPNFIWNNFNNSLFVNGDIHANSINAKGIHYLASSNFIGELGVINGGTGCNILPFGQIIIGNNNAAIITTPNFLWSNEQNELYVKGKVIANIVQGNLIGDGLNISNIVASNIIGVVNLINGGTGCNIIPFGQLIIGNNNNAIITTPNLVWSNIEKQLYVNGDIHATNIQGKFYGNGYNISNLNASNLALGITSVEHGGTGCNMLPFGRLLIGNNINPVLTTDNLVWDNTNNQLNINGNLYTTKIQSKFYGSGNYLSNIVASNIIGNINVNQGGTGCNILPIGNILIGNNSDPIITTSNLLWDNLNNKLTISGNIYTNNINVTNYIVSSDIQGNFIGDGKNISNIVASNIIGVLSIANGGTGSNFFNINEILLGNNNNALITSNNLKWDNSTDNLLINGNIISHIIQGKFYGDGTNISNFVASNLFGQIPISQGGTGCNYIPQGQLIIGNNDSPILTTSNIIWNNINNSLTVKGDVFVENIRVNRNIVSGSLPNSKFIGDAANVSNFVASNIVGLISVANGGTGKTSLPLNEILLGNNNDPIASSPNFTWDNSVLTLNVSGGTIYSDTLISPSTYATNLNISDSITVNKSINNIVTASIIQGSLYGDGNNVSNFVGSNIIGTVSVINGGTGCNILPSGQLLIGNDINALMTTPKLSWNNDTLTVNGDINTHNIITINNISSTNIQGKFYGDGTNISNIVASNIIGPGILPVTSGGTGYSIIPHTQILVGNNSDTLTTTANFTWDNELDTLTANGTIYTNSIIARNAIYCTNLNILTELTVNKGIYNSIVTNNIQGNFIGNGANISNLIASNLIGVVLVENGGTGCNILPKGKLLIGNNTNPITTISDLEWNDNNNTLKINGDIYTCNINLIGNIHAKNIQGKFYGDGTNISNLIASNIIGPGILSVINGGTGYSSIPNNQILIGNNSDTLITTPNLTWDDTSKIFIANGTMYTDTININNAVYTTTLNTDLLTVNKSIHNSIITHTIQGEFIGDGTNISNLSGNSIVGIISVNNGGTGCNILPKGNILIGNNTNPINTLNSLYWDDINNKLNINGNIETINIVSSNSIYSDNIQGKFYGDGRNISNIGASSLIGVINVLNGGTGLSTIPQYNILIGNGTNNVETSDNLIFNSDSLYVNGIIYTNLIDVKTSFYAYSLNIVDTLIANNAKYISLLTNNIQGKFYGDGTNISNIIANNIIGTVQVANGGTGCNILPKGKLLIGNNTNPITTISDLEWNDTNNKLSINGDIYANDIKLTNNLYTSSIQSKFYGDGTNISNLVASNIIGAGIISVINGGTGRSILDSSQILIGNGTNAILTTPNLIWDNSLNNLTVSGIIYTDEFIASNSIYTTTVNISDEINVENIGTISKLYTNNTQGKFIGDGTNISNIIASNIIGTIQVINGGTGCNILPTGNILIGNNTDPILTTSDLVWNKNNKILNINGNISANNITTNNLYTINTQGKFYGDGTNISNLVASNIIGSSILNVLNGGTGYSTIPQYNILVGNNNDTLITSSDFTWDNIQKLLNVNGTIYTNYLNVDISLYSTSINVLNDLTVNKGTYTNIYANNLQGKFYGDGYNISNLNINNISSGTLTTINGGTGCNLLPLNELLIGNSINPIKSTSDLKWVDNQLIINGNIITSNINVTSLYANNIQGKLYGDGTNISNIITSNIIGTIILPVSQGGIGTNTLPLNQILLGNDTNPITSSPSISYYDNSLYILGTLATNSINASIGIYGFSVNVYENLIANKGNFMNMYANKIQGKYYGDGNNVSNLDASKLVGTVNVSNGGTGCNILPMGQILIGNNTDPIITTPNLSWNNNTLTVNGIINTSNLSILDKFTINNIETSNVTMIGWNTINSTYYGLKYNNKPFYISLYLTNNITSGINIYPIPFNVNYGTNAGMTPSSLNIEPNYWNNDHFIPPVNGIYSINYSVCCSDKCYIWLNKGSDFTNNYNTRFGLQNSLINNGCTTSITIKTLTSDSWYFIVKNTGTDILVYDDIIGNTKASISLIQESL